MLLNEFLNEQPIVTKTLINAINNNKVSHAYLFETNDYYNSKKLIISFVKSILCPNGGCNNCNICKQIDNNEYIELKIIDPEGMQIKKEEMLNLQNEFKNKAIEGNKKIYILNNAEKLNSSSSNSILKFLEEPEENIIAILVTTNRYQMMNTIQSRCQLISFKNFKENKQLSTFLKINDLVYNNSNLIDEDTKNEQITNTLSFINFYEKNNLNTLLFINREFFQYFKNRENVLNAFEMMKLFYLDVLKNKNKQEITTFNDFRSEISEVTQRNTIKEILIKINTIMKYIDRIKYNVNINLLLDSFIIELGDELND